MRRLALLLILAGPQAALAEEPLLLRIRPSEAMEGIGAGGAAPPDELARQAWLAREAVWERSRRNAEIAIASICTGCLGDPKPSLAPAATDGNVARNAMQTTQLGP